MYRERNAAIADTPFEPPRFIFGNSETDECSQESAKDSGCPDTRQRRDNRSSRNDSPQLGDGNRPSFHQPADHASGNAAGEGARYRALERLGIFYVSKVLCARIVGEERRTSARRKPARRRCATASPAVNRFA